MTRNKNIALVHINLKVGGAERSTLLLYDILSRYYNVYIILIEDVKDLEYEGNILALSSTKSFILNKISKAYQLFKTLKKLDIDIVIDSRTKQSLFKESLFLLIYHKYKKIYLIRSYNISNYLCNNNFFSRYILRQVDHFVCVSKEIETLVKKRIKASPVSSINNYFKINTDTLHPIELCNSYILYFGRIENHCKDLLFLIESYSKSLLPDIDIKLVLLGDGIDKESLIKKVNHLGLSNKILFRESVTNPVNYIKNAIYTVMTSNYEGFPRAILESLSLGIPVVATRFKSGLDELVKNRYNGLITEKNQSCFIKALEEMITNKELYINCKSNAEESVLHLNENNIAKQWKNLIDNL